MLWSNRFKPSVGLKQNVLVIKWWKRTQCLLVTLTNADPIISSPAMSTTHEYVPVCSNVTSVRMRLLVMVLSIASLEFETDCEATGSIILAVVFQVTLTIMILFLTTHLSTTVSPEITSVILGETFTTQEWEINNYHNYDILFWHDHIQWFVITVYSCVHMHLIACQYVVGNV